MEALFDGEGDHHPYRPSTIAILIVTVKVAKVTKFHMDGSPTTISFGYQVLKGNLQ